MLSNELNYIIHNIWPYVNSTGSHRQWYDLHRACCHCVCVCPALHYNLFISRRMGRPCDPGMVSQGRSRAGQGRCMAVSSQVGAASIVAWMWHPWHWHWLWMEAFAARKIKDPFFFTRHNATANWAHKSVTSDGTRACSSTNTKPTSKTHSSSFKLAED